MTVNRYVYILVCLLCIAVQGCLGKKNAVPVDAFLEAIKHPITHIQIQPVHVGTSVMTVSETIDIDDPTTIQEIVEELKMEDTPQSPETSLHPEFFAGCKLEITVESDETFTFFVRLWDFRKSRCAVYFLAKENGATTFNDAKLAGWGQRGMGYSPKLYELIWETVAQGKWVYSSFDEE
jgi:hypothetical protein